MHIKIEHLTKKYGNTLALDNVSITFDPGIYGLLGHNGAGKTTLIKILATIIAFDKGKISFNNLDMHKYEKQYREVLGYMPQQQQLPESFSIEGFLYYMAAFKNMKKDHANTVISTLLQQVNLYDQRKKRLDALSGGMKQRVMIAQSLLNDPAILLLDEPTAGLDPVERRNFRELIASISENRIVLLATHVITDIEFIANQIILMKKGEILKTGTQEDLLTNTNVYESYETLDTLKANDETFKLVNIMRDEKGKRIRFISKKQYVNKVGTMLDDVYLDWLG